MAKERYNHREIEQAAQDKWEQLSLYQTDLAATDKDPYYLLFEFPYPSGDLHIGHWYAYALTDIYARYLRMKGKNVLFPIGFDAFGLPAENAAIKNGVDPKEWTYANMDRMRAQIRTIGTSVDWSKEVVTSEPSYYKWTQWLFAKLFEQGLAERRNAPVKWCPKDQTVLANEQVNDGLCERCGSQVEEKNLTQWFLKITKYADRLLRDLDPLPWREEIKEAQRAWIGESAGTELTFKLKIEKVERFVLLHGKGGSSKGDFLPWLKERLEADGYEVEVPDMPNSKEPDDEEQAEYVAQNCTLDENTVVLGHSFGGIVALRLLERGYAMNRVILAGTPRTDAFKDGKARESVSRALAKGFDFDGIRSKTAFSLIYDINDSLIDVKDGEQYAAELRSPLTRVEATAPHFNATEEPSLYQACIPAINVFTTRPDTIFGATYAVIAPEHPVVDMLLAAASNKEAIMAYRDATSRKTELERQENKEKTGVRIEGVTVINPANGEEIPLYAADYVLGSYGTGAVMAVPAHDERDFEFAKKFGLPVRCVIRPDLDAATEEELEAKRARILNGEECYLLRGDLMASGKFNGRNWIDAKEEITEAFGRKVVNYRLRDWLVSRQRYWGCPIPVVYDPGGAPHLVPAEHLPWLLPTDVDFSPTGVSPLATSKELKERVTRIFGEGWTPEYDTLDTFVDSSWYYLRYLDPKDEHDFTDQGMLKKWMPVDRYSGGAEHTTMHLLYSRFFNKALYDLALVPTAEPFNERFNRGIILGPDGAKMSKSKGNVINPDEFVTKYGSDAVRMYLAFIGPYNEPGSYPWNLDGVDAMRKFLDRVYSLKERVGDAVPTIELDKAMRKAAAKIGSDSERFKFNTAISALMIALRELEGVATVPREMYLNYLHLLAPFAPHLSEHLFEETGGEGSVHASVWPAAEVAAEEAVTIILQVNGKKRGEITIGAEASEEEVVAAARLVPAVANALHEGEVAKTVYVAGRILNLVLKGP